jgi:hypothetical protein
MPSNKLRLEAQYFLQLAAKAHDEGRLADARALTLKAAEHLEDAVSLEELRQKHLPKAAHKAAPVTS